MNANILDKKSIKLIADNFIKSNIKVFQFLLQRADK